MPRLQRLVRADLNRAVDLTQTQRSNARSKFSQIHVDPDCVGTLFKYLAQGEVTALDEFSVRMSQLLGEAEADVVMRSVRQHIPELLRGDELVSFESRVTRDQFKRTADSQADQLGGINAKLDRLIADSDRPRVLLLDWVPQRRRSELAELAEASPELVGQLDEAMDPLEESLRPAKAKELLEERPSWLDDPPPLLLSVITRFIESGGFWSRAADAWEEIGSIYEEQANLEQERESLLNAAVAAQLAGEEERRTELLDLVRSEKPDHPRLMLEGANALEGGAERLALLEGLDPEEDDIKVLLACHRGLAYLLEEDLDAAAAELSIAEGIDPDRVQVKMFAINISIETGRRAIRANLRLPVEDLREQLVVAQEVRQELLRQARVDEAMRCLMLAADAAFLVDGPVEAGRILVSISEEELDAPDAPVVIGEVALRAQAPLSALAVTSGVSDGNEIRRIRAAAKTRLDTAELQLVLDACSELEALIEASEVDGELAAIFRLLACLHHKDVPWHGPSEDRLERDHLKEAALGVKALFHARKDGLSAADTVIEAGTFSSERVLAECRFQCAFEIKERQEAAVRARRLLEVGTDQINRHLCAMALEEGDDLDRSRAEARALLDDPGVPSFVRSEMFALLTKMAMDSDDLGDATLIVDQWLMEFPKDNRANWLRVQIAAKKNRQ